MQHVTDDFARSQPAGTLAERILSEATIRLAAAAAVLGEGRGGRPLHPATLVRWILRGARGPTGGRVKLEAVRVGSGWTTSREALARFCSALTSQIDDRPAPRTPTQRRRAAERAAKQLERAGI